MDDAITVWLSGLARGDELATQQIWQRYCHRLAGMARKKLGDNRDAIADEEDVALGAFDSFCRAAAAGRFPRLDDRHDLWRLLVTITAHKAVSQIRRQRAEKRGGGDVRGESAFLHTGDAGGHGRIDEVLGNEPSPEFAAMMSEQCERRVALAFRQCFAQYLTRTKEHNSGIPAVAWDGK